MVGKVSAMERSLERASEKSLHSSCLAVYSRLMCYCRTVAYLIPRYSVHTDNDDRITDVRSLGNEQGLDLRSKY